MARRRLTPIGDIQPAELEQIRKRRQVAAKADCDDNATASWELKDDLVGLALSGGGIRSALFNLGVVQAFSHKGLLRYVDYLCSVSGGGYTAGHLAELALSRGEPDQNFHLTKEAELDADPETGRIKGETNISRPAAWLLDYLGLAWRYVAFTTVKLAFYTSLLGFLACGLAYLWRVLDYESFRDYFYLANGLESGDELLTALLPALIVLALWIASLLLWVFWAVLSRLLLGVAAEVLRVWSKVFSSKAPKSSPASEPPTTQRSPGEYSLNRIFMFLLVAAAAIGLLIFFGNGVTAVRRTDDVSQLFTLKDQAKWVIIALVAIQLLSLLGFKQVLRSGRDQAPLWQKFVREFVSFVALVGPPAAMLLLMGRDNISRYADARGPDLERYDISDDRAFSGMWSDLTRRNGDQVDSALRTIDGSVELTRKLAWLAADSARLQQLRESIMGKTQFDQRQRRPLFTLAGTRLAFTTLDDWLDRPESPTLQYTSGLHAHRQSQEGVCRQFNEQILASPLLTRAMVEDVGRRLSKEGKPVEFSQVDEFIEDRASHMNECERLTQRWGLATSDGSLSAAALEKRLANWGAEEIKTLNRLLMEAIYPSVIRPRTTIFTSLVIHHDQEARKEWAVTWLWLFLGSGIVVAFIWKCGPLHRFYQYGLFQNYLRTAQDESSKPKMRSVSRLHTCDIGMPYHLFLGAAIHPEPDAKQRCMEAYPFLFSEKFCGGGMLPYEPSGEYEKRQPLALLDAMSISGAAVSSRMTASWGLWLMMNLFNLNLGRRLRAPRGECKALSPTKWPHVADGGFREYFGLEELLQRRCRLMIVSDAACNNGKYELGALADVVRKARAEHGIEFLDIDHDRPIDISRVRRVASMDLSDDSPDLATPPGSGQPGGPGDAARVPQQIMAIRVKYPAPDPASDEKALPEQAREGVIFYLQMALSGAEDVDLQQFRNLYPNFPDESTLNQFFTGEQSESYRQLGYHIGAKLCSELPTPRWTARKHPTPDDEGSAAANCPSQVGGWNHLTVKGVEDRMLVAYHQECFLERTVIEHDVTPMGLVAEACKLAPVYTGREKDQRPCEMCAGELPCTAEEALQRIENDSEFRRRCRLQVYRAIRPPLVPEAADYVFNDESINAQLIVSAIVCYELVNGPFVSARRAVFQVGGRQRLIDAAEELGDKLPFEALDLALSISKPFTSAFQAVTAHQVFQQHGSHVAELLGDLLKQKSLHLSKVVADVSKPQPGLAPAKSVPKRMYIPAPMRGRRVR